MMINAAVALLAESIKDLVEAVEHLSAVCNNLHERIEILEKRVQDVEDDL